MTRFASARMSGIEKTLIRQVNDRADASCLNLGLGELVFPTPAAILDGVRRGVGSWRHGYTANAGLGELRELIAHRAGPGLAAENVCVTIGAEEALFAALFVLVNSGDEVLVPDPGFPSYATIVRMAGGAPVAYPLSPASGFALDPRAIAQRITGRTRVLILNSPHNPTGTIVAPEALAALAELCAGREITLISDEVYREVVFEEEKAESLARFSAGTVVIDSLSKTYSMTGWRLGWCVAPQQFIRMIETFNQLAISCPPVVCQRAAMLALEGAADEEKRRNLLELAKRRELALRCLREFTDLDFARPSGTFYVYADIGPKLRPGRTSLDAALELIEREKVVTIPGLAFGKEATDFLRISFAAAPADIEEGLRRIGRFFGKG